MKRYDLRHLHDDFYDRMAELIDQGLKVGEVGIFLFEIGDFSHIQKSADFIRELGHDLMNSLKFNEVDWTIMVKRVDEETRKARAEQVAVARAAAERKAAEEVAAAEEKARDEAKDTEEKAEAEAEVKAKDKAEPKEAAATKVKTETPKKIQAKEDPKAKGAVKKAAVEAKETKAEEAKVRAEANSKPANKKAAPKAKKTESRKNAGNKGDDLTKIIGIGKAYTEKLNSEGIYTFEDVANMTEEQIRIMEEKYSFKGDFKESVADAKKLLKAKAK